MNYEDKNTVLSTQNDGITVLSLCDGMSGGQVALKELGIPIKEQSRQQKNLWKLRN